MTVLLEIDLVPGQEEGRLASLATRKYHSELTLVRILKRSIDARKKDRLVIKYRAVFEAPERDRARLLSLGGTVWQPESADVTPPARHKPSVVIVGSGPAGLLCALRLAEAGVNCTVLEQGKAVEERHRDIERLKAEGVLDPDSNVVFGEGGAGTYSDGKLTTRIHKPGISWVFDRLVEHGAPEAILYEAKPHVGTDLLSKVVTSMRLKLESQGTRVLFGQKVVELVTQGSGPDRRVAGVRTARGDEFAAEAVVLATGHSSRALYELLAGAGTGSPLVALERKGFAVGVRIEHPAEFIGRAQYGRSANLLPAADYRLAWTNPATNRGTYSFCMCPGGEVVNSSSENNLLCVNGMSYSRRDLAWSNSAVVTQVNVTDGPEGQLGGLEFQRSLERAAFVAGGGGQTAPGCSARGFLSGKPSLLGRALSYAPRVVAADFRAVLPPFVASELALALADFDRKIPGFIDEGTLIGVETRTSSPVRILRGEDFQSPSLRGLYPAGEGAGYAGGIISSAVDGLRIADALTL
ncbi:MAG: FAD-dependent oxidoreductase [Spirochaetales bacterium]